MSMPYFMMVMNDEMKLAYINRRYLQKTGFKSSNYFTYLPLIIFNHYNKENSRIRLDKRYETLDNAKLMHMMCI
jgi:hypothetical protein